MNQKNIFILLGVVAIVLVSLFIVYSYLPIGEVRDAENDSINITLNSTNDTQNNTTATNAKSTKTQTKSQSKKSSESKKSGSDSDEWEYGHGAGSYDDPDITWKHNKKTGYTEYQNKKTGENWGGYNIA